MRSYTAETNKIGFYSNNPEVLVINITYNLFSVFRFNRRIVGRIEILLL
jgi:hypothetical protein